MNTKIKKQNLRQIQAEERRLQILDVALNVFASNGFKGTSIKDIAEAAGISLGLMYHYFGSKEELLEATVEHHSFLPQMAQILLDSKDRPISDVFNDLAIGYLNLLDRKAELVKILIQEVETNPEVKKAWSNLVHETLSLLQKYLDSQVVNGELRKHNTEVTARSILSILFMYHFTQNIFRSSRVKRDEYIGEVLTNMLKGLGAR